MSKSKRRLLGHYVALTGALLGITASTSCVVPATAMGVLTPHPLVKVHVPAHTIRKTTPVPSSFTRRASSSIKRDNGSKRAVSTKVSSKRGKNAKTAPVKKPVVASKPLQPQEFAEKMAAHEIAPGVTHKYFRGPLTINLLDIDLMKAPVKVQPTLAGDSFNRLKDVADHAKECNAIAAINANYFKRNGVPLGTLIIDGEWISGPLYDRVAMGITREGRVRIDRVSFGGMLTSNNPDVPQAWVNSINSPRRHGMHMVAYTRRWGPKVHMDYEGSLVALDAQGYVVDKSLQDITIPYGGYVLSDCKDSSIAKLQRGDHVNLSWRTTPNWDDVAEAVSGGPMLIRDGKLYLDLKDENFRRAWTGSQIKARTVAGVTANNHLLLATIEGPHTLWDIAKFLQKMGAVDALNLDGGGSTTMVINGSTVTRNANASQRRVASSLAVLDLRKTNAPIISRNVIVHPAAPQPTAETSILGGADNVVPVVREQSLQLDPGVNISGPLSTRVAPAESQAPAAIPDATPPASVEIERPAHKKHRLFGLFK